MTTISGQEFYLTAGQRCLVNRFENNPDFSLPIQRVYLLSNDFNYSAFVKALQHVLICNPSLRLQLVKTAKGWRQRFPDQNPNISEVKVRGIGRLYRTIYADLLIAEETKKAFDLRFDPPVKARVFKVNKSYLLSLCLDHIAADGISFDLFERALLCSYQNVLHCLPQSTTPDKGFLEFISKEIKQHKHEKNNLLFWQQQLRGAPISVNINPKIKRMPVIANEFRYQFDGAHFIELANICKILKCTVFNIIVACQLLLLSERFGPEDIVLSIPFSNRILAEEKCIIGNVVVPLHVRFSLIPNEPISKFILRIKETTLDAFLHRQFDFPSLLHFLVEQSKMQNGTLNLTKECNLIVVNDPMPFPNSLFAARIDNFGKKILKTSFNVLAHQSGSMVSINITWDGTTWPISEKDMATKFQQVIQLIYMVNKDYNNHYT